MSFFSERYISPQPTVESNCHLMLSSLPESHSEVFWIKYEPGVLEVWAFTWNFLNVAANLSPAHCIPFDPQSTYFTLCTVEVPQRSQPLDKSPIRTTR